MGRVQLKTKKKLHSFSKNLMQVHLLRGNDGVQNTLQSDYAINWEKILCLTSLLKICSHDEHNEDFQ